jgi:Uma2 family endonuclease
MATVPSRRSNPVVDYPDSDGKPIAETPRHRDDMMDLIKTTDAWLADDPMTYVSGNMLMYYVPGDRRRHVVPDVFAVWGVPRVRVPQRRYFLVWEEKAPGVIIELTSASTRDEDLHVKFEIYQDIIKVQEYFLFDPFGEYLDPPLRGYRLRRGRYGAIRPVQGRLPSKLLGLHLEAAGEELRLYDPARGLWLPTPQEAQEQAEAGWQQAEAGRQQAEAERQRVEAENLALRQELDALRRRLAEGK